MARRAAAVWGVACRPEPLIGPGPWRPLRAGASLHPRAPQVMQAQFAQDNNPDAQTLQKLADMTGLSRRVIQVGPEEGGPSGLGRGLGAFPRAQSGASEPLSRAHVAALLWRRRDRPAWYLPAARPIVFREAETAETVVPGVVSKLPGAS